METVDTPIYASDYPAAEPVHLPRPYRSRLDAELSAEPAAPVCQTCFKAASLPDFDGCLACEVADALAHPDCFDDNVELGCYGTESGQLIVNAVAAERTRRFAAGEAVYESARDRATKIIAEASTSAALSGDVETAEMLLRAAIRTRRVA